MEAKRKVEEEKMSNFKRGQDFDRSYHMRRIKKSFGWR